MLVSKKVHRRSIQPTRRGTASPKDCRRTAEGSQYDNAKNQHFMYSLWRFVYQNIFQQIDITTKKAGRRGKEEVWYLF